ncbi:MAG: DNA polymerase III subunit alpha, partial [Solirubrobacterales bacterium]|nr:DNA polymerase III subunit alpha [Solirubrobacterales bacterium]
ADDLRKAIGKKKREMMSEMEPKFMQGLEASGTDRTLAKELWKINEAAADYSFNKSHAACYALIAYQTAYLKANYPAEYMAAVISSVMSTKDKVPFFVSHCSSMGIRVLPPDVNVSDHSFVVDEGDIRFGLDAVKNVGYSAVEAIIHAREGRPFESLWDFCERVDNRAVNKRAIECLIKCGAFDSLPGSRKGMLEKLPDAAAAGAQAQSDEKLGQGTIFDDMGDEETGGSGGHEPISEVEFERKELLALEKETMGTFLSSHPLDGLKEAILAEADCTLGDLKHQKDGSRVKVGGLVTAYKKVRTRAGKQIAFATLSDIENQIELMLFNLEDSEKQQLVQLDEVVLVRGTIDQSEEGAKLKVRDAELFSPSEAQIEKAREAYAKKNKPFVVRVVPEQMSLDTLEEMKSVFDQHQGDSDVVMVVDGEREHHLKLGPDYRVRHSPGLTTEIDQIFGEGTAARAA